MTEPASTTPANANAADAPPTPGAAHRRLQRFVGTWRTAGEIVAEPGAAPMRLEATDRYEWMPGGFFLLHHVDGRMGDAPVRALEVIGHDAARGAYVTHAFDDRGTASSYTATLDGDDWSILGAAERFTGRFGDGDATLAGTWERRLDDGTWAVWMRIRLTRAA